MKKVRLLIMLALVATCAFMMRGKIPHEKFDKHLWKTANLNSEENWSLRWDMMNDLRNRHKLVGMTKSQVIDLLGNPGDISGSEFNYYLGYTKTGINTGSLTISFNDKGVVTQIHVWQG